jgi:hypothetical protein
MLCNYEAKAALNSLPPPLTGLAAMYARYFGETGPQTLRSLQTSLVNAMMEL